MTRTPPLTREIAVQLLRGIVDARLAGVERMQASRAVAWLDEHCAEMERRARAEDDTREVP